MTTITIENDTNLSRTRFEDIDDLLSHFMEELGIGLLLPLSEDDKSKERKTRFEKALKTPKSEMLNI